MVVPKRQKTQNGTRWCGLRAIPKTISVAVVLFVCLFALASLSFQFQQQNYTYGKQLRRAGQRSDEGDGEFWTIPPRPPLGSRIRMAKGGASKNSTTSSRRYLIFRPPLEAAQGVGNLMNGLLAAHTLGIEFERFVCVSKDWKAFHGAFQSVVPECQEKQQQQQQYPRRTSQNTIWLLNFSKNPINECDLQQRLRGSEPIIYLVANTYPEWPTTTGMDPTLLNIRMEDSYRLKPDLVNILPWSEAPTTVVHLRQADNENIDHRVGLDSATLAALGATLTSASTTTTATTPYLVTNQVDFYDYFETKFGWSHPPWMGIRHSAISNVQWTTTTSLGENHHQERPPPPITTNYREQTLQLWADWWTIYKAKTVYHTHSDFSASAARWSGTTASYEIEGLDDQNALILFKNQKTRDDGSKPFSKRSHILLKHCDVAPWKSNGLGYVLDLDDEMHDDLVDDWKNKKPLSTK